MTNQEKDLLIAYLADAEEIAPEDQLVPEPISVTSSCTP